MLNFLSVVRAASFLVGLSFLAGCFSVQGAVHNDYDIGTFAFFREKDTLRPLFREGFYVSEDRESSFTLRYDGARVLISGGNGEPVEFTNYVDFGVVVDGLRVFFAIYPISEDELVYGYIPFVPFSDGSLGLMGLEPSVEFEFDRIGNHLAGVSEIRRYFAETSNPIIVHRRNR